MTAPVVLDLCAGTGAWSRPYKEAGYHVIYVTLPEVDVRLLHHLPGPVHGILAAPPCTAFARCGARWWKSKGEQALFDGLSVVDACLRAVVLYEPVWWALENPVGRLRHYLGEPTFAFDPWEFGDPWTKKTWLWGRFTPPRKLEGAVKPRNSVPGHRNVQYLRTRTLEKALIAGCRTLQLGPSKGRAALRAITPPAFARAFFEANP